eukprot:CAMPEP_0194028284 /NCGR_PEP_ID=MMETSP0009_2-20130614/2300_1 /TAXON_ID=210454 /ORGANISM="Grammatophora oceanica, Strain CCMP 410" /LENGTH=86 /DNA_ID=CAMNT_0038667629 /DNA_START=200 /DNA_END=460 /DNA_ORIENTATION=-
MVLSKSKAFTSASDEAVSTIMKDGLETIVIQTGAGIVVGCLAGAILTRKASGMKMLGGLGGGIGLGSAWTKTSVTLEEMLSRKFKK